MRGPIEHHQGNQLLPSTCMHTPVHLHVCRYTYTHRKYTHLLTCPLPTKTHVCQTRGRTHTHTLVNTMQTQRPAHARVRTHTQNKDSCTGPCHRYQQSLLCTVYRPRPRAVPLPCRDEGPHDGCLDSTGPAVCVCTACTFPTGTGNTHGKHLLTQKWATGWLWPLLCGVLSR